MATLTPRQRVLTTLDHREPDRAPLDFAATTVTGITFLAYEQLRRHLELEPDPTPRTADVHQGLCDPREDLVLRYESDFRTVRMKRSPRGVRAREMSDDSFYDGDTIVWKRALHGYHPASTPLAECTIADLDRVQWPDPRDPRRVEGLREEARTLYEGTDYAIVADDWRVKEFVRDSYEWSDGTQACSLLCSAFRSSSVCWCSRRRPWVGWP